MKRPRVRRRWLIPLSIVLAPPLFWAIVLTVTPTEWARTRIVSRLGQATGRPVRLGSVKIGALGGVHLANLEIGAPGADRDPWLTVASARINVSVVQLLAGQVEPSQVQVDGMVLRVLRRRDGTLELADMLRAEAAAPAGPTSGECPGPASVELRLRGARIIVIDEDSRTRLDLAQVEGRATTQGRHTAIHDLHGTINGGTFELAATVERTADGPSFDARFRSKGVALGEGTNALAYLVPVLSGLPDDGSVDGRLDANLYLRGHGATRLALRRTIVGQGALRLDPVALDKSRFLAEVARMIELPREARVGSVKTDFTVKDGRVATDNLTLELAGVPIVLAGWTDFDGNLDYHVRSESVAARLPGKARDLLAEVGVDTKDLAALRLRGTLDDMQVSLRPGPLDGIGGPGAPARRINDRKRLQEIGRRFRDRILR